MIKRIVIAATIVAFVAIFLIFDLGAYLSFDNLKQSHTQLAGMRDTNPILLSAAFFAIYVLVTALSLPGASVMTLGGGAFFGLAWGLVLVSFASTAGATLAFLSSRYIFKDAVQKRFGDRLETINRGIENEGAFYLFMLRLVPLVPFFVVNLVMGVTPISTRTYIWVSQVGMLAGTVVYVNAGTQLGKLEGLSGIFSPSLILSFAVLGLFPLVAKRVIGWVRNRKSGEST